MNAKKYLLFIAAVFFSVNIFAQTGLKTGADAPMFSATDNAGKNINLKNLLKTHNAVVLFFYRGQWCPYCNKHIQQLQDSLQLLTAKGAYVVGVTPETGENIGKTIEKTHASFSMVHDEGYKIMKAYDVDYKVADPLYAKLKGYGIDLEKGNGNTDHILPVPATYIINQSGKITFVQFDKDYTKRPSVRQILQAL